jgi:hypothetical protein
MRKVVLFMCALGVLVGGCSSKTDISTATSSPAASASAAASSSASVPPGGEPQTAAELKAIAQLHFNSFESGDWGAFWDDFDTGSKAVVARDEYIRRLTECSKSDRNRGKPLVVQGVADNHNGTWTVIVHYAKFEIRFPALYESGHWRFVLDEKARVQMRRPFAAYVAACRA